MYPGSAPWRASLDTYVTMQWHCNSDGHFRVINSNSICHTQRHLSHVPEGSCLLPQGYVSILCWKPITFTHRQELWLKEHRHAFIPLGFPGGASGKEPACQCRRHKRCKFNTWVRKIPRKKAWQPTPVFLPEESHGEGSLSLWATVHRVAKSQTLLKRLSV